MRFLIDPVILGRQDFEKRYRKRSMSTIEHIRTSKTWENFSKKIGIDDDSFQTSQSERRSKSSVPFIFGDVLIWIFRIKAGESKTNKTTRDTTSILQKINKKMNIHLKDVVETDYFANILISEKWWKISNGGPTQNKQKLLSSQSIRRVSLLRNPCRRVVPTRYYKTYPYNTKFLKIERNKVIWIMVLYCSCKSLIRTNISILLHDFIISIFSYRESTLQLYCISFVLFSDKEKKGQINWILCVCNESDYPYQWL